MSNLVHAIILFLCMQLFITTVFGENFDWRDLSKVNLREIVEKDSKSK